MVVLRSRKVTSVPTKPISQSVTVHAVIGPVTPSKTVERTTSNHSPTAPSHSIESGSVSARRRSARIASKLVLDESSRDDSMEKKIDCDEINGVGKSVRSVEGGVRATGSVTGTRRKRKLEVVEDCVGLEADGSKRVLSLRSGKKVVKNVAESSGGDDKVVNQEKEVEKSGGLVVDRKLGFEPEEGRSVGSIVERKREDKRKGKMIVSEADEVDDVVTANVGTTVGTRRRFTRKEKGKEPVVEDGSLLKAEEAVELSSRPQGRSRTEQFRDIAKQNASHFAFFDPKKDEYNNLPHTATDSSDDEMEMEGELEDWPGPFSTAMNIIRDREEKMNSQNGNLSSTKTKPVPVVTWTPKNGRVRDDSKPLVSSLRELCMKVLVENADAITSLECVPDALRHQLSQVLCDSRRMNAKVLDLLLSGTPTEVRVRDCSWLSEELFTQCFNNRDMSNLTVLQLDQCGRCMVDYLLPSTLVRSLSSLPALTTLSLSGACRLTDFGLQSLLSSTPALRSLNLSQCSLLSSAIMDTIASLLGTVLKELYITDCQSMDAMLILPALKKLESLEVLSVAGMQTVRNRFVREFATARGHNMKELILADCLKLTDSSMKVIAETCPGLYALDLVNLNKLTDSTLGFLANGCRRISSLKLCRNSFSDEGVAAYLETSGEQLKELSLNNVKKVDHNTALSIARRARKLQKLDVSWCRNLTDEAMGLIVDNCLSLRVLKLFGCTQITNVFVHGHSNPDVQIIGLQKTLVLEHLNACDPQEAPLHYSSISSL